MAKTYCMILTTASSQEEANLLAGILVNNGLAACVQISAITSTYRWQGALHTEPEWLLRIKTRAELYSQVEKTLLENHTYEIPEIVCMPIAQGAAPYLAWIDDNTRGAQES
jgi:periplasmic divalent cation tolerance protein